MKSKSYVLLTRGRAAQICSLIGFSGLIIGIIGLIWQSGANANYALIALGIGIAGIVGWAALTPQEFTAFVTGKQARYGTVTIVSVALLIGIVALVYVLLAQAALTLDMTENRRYSLSSETENVLNRVSRPIQLTGFYTPRNLPLQEEDDQFFRLYEDATGGLITRQYIDPEENPAQAQRFAVIEDGQVYISYLNSDGTIDFSTLARVPRSGTQERDVTGAIARLLAAGQLTVYFETSNDERSPLDATAEGLSGINAGIQESGVNTQPLDLAQIALDGGDIPADASAVIFARPLRDLTTEEIAVIDRYLDRGGSLFIMTDVLFTDNAFLQEDGAFNQYLWENYGIHALDAVIVDPAASGQTPLDIISAAVFAESDIAARLDPASGTPTLFRIARAVDIDLDTQRPDLANGRVIMSSPDSYGETNLQALGDTNTYQYDAGTDIPGPLASVVWATNLDTESRIVLVGDSDFATNGQIMSGGNSLLFTDALTWITDFNDQLEFAPQAYATGLPTLFVSQQQIDLVVFIAVILVPGIVLISGLSIWARRARA
jgi:ABC-type uncharacterized transport system involved in gliding motility auxiliary subunit